VADDNEDAATSLAMLLELMGHEVRVAHDGLQAVVMSESFRPEVIVLDIGMTQMNGYEACRRIRARAWASATLVIAVTGWGQDQDRRRSLEAGFEAHLTKPLDPKALERLIDAHRPVSA
jgi:CheY-like chemotaxis protein